MFSLTIFWFFFVISSTLGTPTKMLKHNTEKHEPMTNTLVPIPVFNIAASKVDFLNSYPSTYTIAEIDPEQNQGFRKLFRIGSQNPKRPATFLNAAAPLPQFAQFATYPTAVSRQSSTIIHDAKNAISPLAAYNYNRVIAAPEFNAFSIVPYPERNNEIYLPIERFVSPYSAYSQEFEIKGPVPIIQPSVRQQPCYPNGVIEPIVMCA